MEDPAAWASFKAELLTWVGTPFFPGVGSAAKKQVAADCVSFINGAIRAVRPFDGFEWPTYAASMSGPGALFLLEEHLAKIRQLAHVHRSTDSWPHPEFLRGDLILVSTGRNLHHLCVYIEDRQVIHSLQGRGVCLGSTEDPTLAKHVWGIYRLKAS